MKILVFRDEQVLFEGYGWALIQDNSGSLPRVYGSHAKCSVSYDGQADNQRGYEAEGTNKALNGRRHYGDFCWAGDGSEDSGFTCRSCSAVVPTEIQALAVLYGAKGKSW
jgi:hypothetical protein